MRHFWWFSNTVRYSICTWELVIGDHWLFVRIAKRYCCSGTKNPFFHIKYIFMALLKAIDLLRQGAFFGIRNPHTVFQKSIFVQIFKLKKKNLENLSIGILGQYWRFSMVKNVKSLNFRVLLKSEFLDKNSTFWTLCWTPMKSLKCNDALVAAVFVRWFFYWNQCKK